MSRWESSSLAEAGEVASSEGDNGGFLESVAQRVEGTRGNAGELLQQRRRRPAAKVLLPSVCMVVLGAWQCLVCPGEERS